LFSALKFPSADKLHVKSSGLLTPNPGGDTTRDEIHRNAGKIGGPGNEEAPDPATALFSWSLHREEVEIDRNRLQPRDHLHHSVFSSAPSKA